MSFLRECILEVNRMKNTKLPSLVTIDSITYNLYKIYEDIGIKFLVDDIEINSPPGDDNVYSLEELENVMVKNSHRTFHSNGKPYAYLLICNGMASDDAGLPNPTGLGVMFSRYREGTAVFYGNSRIQNNPSFFLRTTVHELGHQFNLHHDDATSKIISGIRKFSIMNQTGTIQNSPALPDDPQVVDNPIDYIGFFFGDLESNHLRNHPSEFVNPGGSLFKDGNGRWLCVAEHSQWHNYNNLTERLGYPPSRRGLSGEDSFIASDDPRNHSGEDSLVNFKEVKPKLEFSIQTGKDEYLPGAPTIAYMELKNTSSEEISVSDQLDPQYEIVKFYIRNDDKDEEIEYKPYVTLDYLLNIKKLKPNKSIKGEAKIFYGASGYSFREPGVYHVRATYNGIFKKPNEIIDSNKIEVKIKEPLTQEEKEQVNLVYGDEQARFLMYEGGDHLLEGIKKLTELGTKFPNTILGGYANTALGVHLNKSFKNIPENKIRKEKPEEAESFLVNAKDNTRGHWADMTYLNLAKIYRERNDIESMTNVLTEFINKFAEDKKNSNAIRNANDLVEKNKK
jgi:hypothetical protein